MRYIKHKILYSLSSDLARSIANDIRDNPTNWKQKIFHFCNTLTNMSIWTANSAYGIECEQPRHNFGFFSKRLIRKAVDDHAAFAVKIGYYGMLINDITPENE